MPIQSPRPNSGFPDIAKTPTPGGPVPVPYPNTSEFPTDTKVDKIKVHGGPKQSSGDEAGTFKSVESLNNLKKHGNLPNSVSFPTSSKVKVK